MSVDGHVAIQELISETSAVALLFATYFIMEIEYEEDASATNDFMQNLNEIVMSIRYN